MSIEKAEILKIDDIFKLNLSIPNYQRPYKWTIKNVQQLIDDLLQNFREGKKIYRIGTIVLNKDKDRSEIVDGQQRLITLSLLLHKLGKDVSLLKEKPNHSISKNNITTNYNFLKNYNFTNEFKDYLLNRCEMVCIELNDLDEAFQFFDSQNARGKPLESYDLLKAYHLRDMRDKDERIIHQCVERWEKSAMSNDINNLDKIINYILFRLRRWHYKENAEIFKLLTIINKPAYKVMFDFDNDDKIIICNKEEIEEEWEKSKDEVEKTFGSDDSIKNFLALSKEGYASFENEMKDSLLYYTLWSWFGGGKSFTISPASSLFSNHKVSAKVKRIYKETLPNGVLELTQQGEGVIKDIDTVEGQYKRDILPLTDHAVFDYQYHIETKYLCTDKQLDFFDSAQTIVHEQASEGYSYITQIEFKIEGSVS